MVKIKKRNLLKADLYRLRQVIGTQLKAGIGNNGDFILYSSDALSHQKLTRLLPFFTEFREQRVDPIRTRIELLEIVDKDEPLFT
ncbi:MAG: hypothetical protein RLZZ360_603 [Candidatus Parcubacteria bacterium]